ncbi:putative G2/mitotic-specific cyclin-4 [Glarea lozoyensis 74030]|uniref:Putative G2/mitotic-specific cyclin-4 n=1 Tax=Glarea lozoyensis (strain ATCC 74030 / MF5533) TaxID=1104152 RepID=H0EQ02_GLAL7|nr:putative G2/mitotic-specific cyclin-4 [Glarea lozoyensis 74030]
MDARPQRGIRPLRLQGDENAAPVTTKQTLHSRHKSTGTLSNMLAVGGLKAAAKRTAFGDVSNTVKSIAVHDDSSAGGKQGKVELVKPVAHPEKPAALLRPAQRSLNVVAAKGITNVAILQPEPILAPIPTKAPLGESRAHAPPPAKRTLSKKSTIIYKDSEAEAKPRPATSHIPKQESALSAPVHKTHEPRHHKSQPQLNSEQPALRHDQSKPTFNDVPDSYAGIITSDPLYEDAEEEVDINSGESNEKYVELAEQKHEHESVYETSAPLNDGADRLHRQLPAPPHLQEPEEYWEDEEEMYDEQGYTTAHSFKSRGDNTTGGATTGAILLPKVTARSKKEIAAAAELVEGSRTQEDIEDEAWDTSMVAEYGDEIFAYMRELEIKMLPNPNYMDNQSEIQWSMRSVLMDWLIQVHHRFSLLPETLFLCVNYIDRFLSCKIVSLGKLQLVGATAIFVAAKYEEINCPAVSEIVYMVDEVTIMDERFVGCPPSYVAAGAHCFARMALKKGDWVS